MKHPQQHVPPLQLHNDTWARTDKQKAKAFAEHLDTVFRPFPSQSTAMDEETIMQELKAPHQMALPLKKIRLHEVVQVIQYKTHTTKAPGYDLITGKILKEHSRKGFRAVTQINNAILRLEYFPYHWKVGEIIMIAKPGKNPADVTSYRTISLLPQLSKILQKILLRRLTPILADAKSIASHQFGFRPQHGTVEQAHRIVHKINDDLDNKRFCTAAFIDISQAFDKVWHTGLFYKLKQALPHPAYTLLTSYLTDRMFQVRYQKEYTPLYAIHSGVPQGSILGPILYSLYSADLPETEQTGTATYADDTAILASHHDSIAATEQLQYHLCRLEQWIKRWRTRANETKSTHVTFTLRREDCPPVYLNGKHIPQDATIKT